MLTTLATMTQPTKNTITFRIVAMMRLILFRRSLVIGNTPPLIAMAIKHQLFCPEFQRTLSVIQISCRKISKHQTTRNSLYLRNKGDALMQLAKYSELFTLLHHLYLRLKPIIRSGLKPMKSLRGVNFYSPFLAQISCVFDNLFGVQNFVPIFYRKICDIFLFFSFFLLEYYLLCTIMVEFFFIKPRQHTLRLSCTFSQFCVSWT